jgi:hypothetical protein
MPTPFVIRSQDAPGVDLAELDGSGNLKLAGFIELSDLAAVPAAPRAGKLRVCSIAGQFVTVDADGDTQLLAGAVGTTAVGTIAGTTAAGASPTVTITDATDERGNFLLNPVTGGGAQAAGKVAVVRFSRAYTTAPGSVTISMANETDSTATIVVAVLAIATTGFDIYVGSALTTAKAYRIAYTVNP